MKGMNGKMIRRIRDNWLPIILTLAILLSLVLSWFIWTNPARYERSRENNTSGQSQLTSKSIADIFLPTQIVKTKQNGTQYLLHAKKNNLVLSIKQKVSKWKFGSEIKVTSDNKQRYQKYLMRKNSISLNYPDQISASVFNQTFGQSISKRRVKQLNRIIIPLHKTKYIYLLNDHTETVYRIHVTKMSQLTKVRQLVNGKTEQYKVKVQFLNDRYIISYPNSVSLPTYSYLMYKQSANSLMTTLLNSVSSSAVSVHKKGHQTTYTDGSNKRMVVNTKSGTVNYDNFSSATKNMDTLNALLTKSFQHLSNIGVPLENIRYDHSNVANKKVVYRGYVESFPIFNQTQYGAVQIKYLKDGEQKYYFSLYSLQVPVPNGTKNVTVPATSDVLQQLQTAGVNLKKIKNLCLGYEWQTNKDSHMVVDLAPTYYVYYQGKWQNYKTLVD